MDEMVNLILDTIENSVTLSSSLIFGKLPEDGGLAVQIAPGSTDLTFLNKKRTRSFNLLFLNKNINQQTCLQELERISDYLSELRIYPNTERLEWVNAITTTEPSYVDREDNGQWIYSMVIDNTISYF